ncbi:hypothetical protein [uncultured Bacteroides sp.]|uniref:hypothetical protein n=1 Tax=uncultured Bacteroides sp. TaxID=162156 RepID=UPI0025DBB3D0|nr:hypothetical protein [uncultured Bacteroides sp.]
MKQLIILSLIALANICYANAQVKVEEPEFSEQAIYLTSDTTFIKLPRENSKVKTKAAASLYLTGIGKVKSRITIDSQASPLSIKESPVIRIILKADNNATDPNSFINIFKFEQKGNRRQAQIAEAGTFSGSETNSLQTIQFNAKKYGESSYLIAIESLEVGEYGITISDPNKLSGKNSFLITTFGVSK